MVSLFFWILYGMLWVVMVRWSIFLIGGIFWCVFDMLRLLFRVWFRYWDLLEFWCCFSVLWKVFVGGCGMVEYGLWKFIWKGLCMIVFVLWKNFWLFVLLLFVCRFDVGYCIFILWIIWNFLLIMVDGIVMGCLFCYFVLKD